ncbi:MAG: acetone carboxylase subunit gamma [Candidatus Lokiarchaeota archaeon]|nr:acetone carboxylase subunit gamma [Candidatus Lokiarchaeota archaeon]MBD3339416.1 acetone carboxylase subunit gamma [Candidatus Lokiarchaeota archaeon]
MVKYDEYTLERMIDGDLAWEELKQIIAETKDPDRFDKIVKILQKRVSWGEKIILPLHEHLYIVVKDGKRIVKCDCGHEFGDYRVNWKRKCRVRVRDTDEEILELYPKYMGCDTNWAELREYICPGCLTLLDVEAVPPGYPTIFNYLPDIDLFYKEWLGRSVPEQ